MTDSSVRNAVLDAVRDGLAGLRSEPVHEVDISTAQNSGMAVDCGTLVELFCTRAAEENATSERIAVTDDMADAIVRYLREQQLAPAVLVTGNILAGALDGATAAGLELLTRPIRPDGETVVTGCFAGIADSGAVVTTSGADCPNEWQYLAETHIVIVPAEQIVADHDAFWELLSAAMPAGLPRSLNWIVGPSRTADLGVPSRLGAHGPARVHLLIVG